MICEIEFPKRWVAASELEAAIRAHTGCDPHGAEAYEVRFRFSTGCKIMADAAVRLLSLVNQLDFCTKRVELIFEEGEAGTMRYLDRLGFFDHLSGNVPVYPARPVISGAEIYGGTNTAVADFARALERATALKRKDTSSAD